MLIDEMLDRIERDEGLDGLIDPVREAVRPALSGGVTSYVLSGAWMGHALHPLMTDLVIGPWASAYVLDLVGGKAGRKAARRLIGVGILASLPTAAAGAHDWVDTTSRARRAGAVHAVANVAGLLLQVASWRARGKGHGFRGFGLSTAAMGALSVGGYLGGHLTYVLGTGVARTAFQQAPDGWTPTVGVTEVQQGPTSVDVDGTPVLLVHDGGQVRALADTCNHAGCSLAQGEVRDGAIVCGCHGSRFALTDGTVMSGPAATAQPTFEVRVVDGVVEVRQPG